jgi:hypothetical protein
VKVAPALRAEKAKSVGQINSRGKGREWTTSIEQLFPYAFVVAENLFKQRHQFMVDVRSRHECTSTVSFLI